MSDRDQNFNKFGEADIGTADRIRRLVVEQRYGVLCTQVNGQPYGSMIALVFTDDLTQAVFSTPRATRKYRNLIECPKVAIVVNNLDHCPGQLMKAEAVTITGVANEVVDEEDCRRWAKQLVKRHPELSGFAVSPSTALFTVKLKRFFLVHSFQKVTQWRPPQIDV